MVTALLTALASWSTPTHAADAAAVLAACDEAMNQASDQTITWKIVNQEPGKKEPRNMRFTVQVKGSQTLTSFEEPADLAGTRVLVLSRNQMYVWLPQYNKVRRIASHVTQQGFMGTTYSYDDMSGSRFGDVYAPASIEAVEGGHVLELAPKEGVTAPYAKARVTIDAEHTLPTRIEYFNDKGVHTKTETRTGYACQGEVCLPEVMRMEEHTREGAWTELRREGWQVNTGIGDDVFSVRNLQRGG